MKKSFLLFFTFLLSLQLLSGKEMLQRVEPLFWWTGMQRQELQLMLYGEAIASAKITVKYPGVSLIRKELTDNPNYVFLYLKIGRKAKPGKIHLSIRKDSDVQCYEYELKGRMPDAAGRETFTAADAIYLLMPDRFVNGNPQNDSIAGYYQTTDRKDPGKRHGGDLDGVISKLPYLADLGITALWLTPFLENNDLQYSYHHYGCSDYYKVDPRLGKNEDYPRLSEEAKKHGIKMIMDVVPNHCSAAHWWLKDLPSKDWFNRWDKFTLSNYRMMAWTDPHAAETDLRRLTRGWFSSNMPDFNLDNSLLFDYLRQVYVFWIEYGNVAGLRVDTYPYNDIKTAARFIREIREEYPKMNIVGECWMNTAQEIAYYQSGNNNKDGFDSNLQSVMDFPLQLTFTQAFNEEEGWNSGLARFYMHYALDFAYPDPDLLLCFLDNHDIDRYALAVGKDVRKYKMALSILLTARGYPQIYYGTEIMLDGFSGSYEGHRFNFPGGWAEDPRDAFSSEGRTAEENEVFNHMRTLLHYRKNNPVLHSGKMKQFIPENGIYVYFRYNEHKTVMVVANNKNEPQEVSLDRYHEMLYDKLSARDILNAHEVDLKQKLRIPAKTVLIFEI